VKWSPSVLSLPRILVGPCRNVGYILRETFLVCRAYQLQTPTLEQHGFLNPNQAVDAQILCSMQNRGVVIGRSFPPYTNWVRITIGQPEENRVAREGLSAIV
jgi:hypothetical protein